MSEGVYRIRGYRPSDREQVRKICADTGFLGEPVDDVFEDRELFADFLTAYYTDCEPESVRLLERDGVVVGYILGCLRPGEYTKWVWRHVPEWFWRACWGYVWRYGAETRRYLRWLVFRGREETPAAPEGAAHLHINLLPGHRQVACTRLLLEEFIEWVQQNGHRTLYGQMVVFEDRRSESFFRRYGFEVLDRRQVTKFQHLTDRRVYLFTVVKDLQKYPGLSGKGRRSGRYAPMEDSSERAC